MVNEENYLQGSLSCIIDNFEKGIPSLHKAAADKGKDKYTPSIKYSALKRDGEGNRLPLSGKRRSINRQTGGVETEEVFCLFCFKGGRGADGFQGIREIQLLPFVRAHFVIGKKLNAFNAFVFREIFRKNSQMFKIERVIGNKNMTYPDFLADRFTVIKGFKSAGVVFSCQIFAYTGIKRFNIQ